MRMPIPTPGNIKYIRIIERKSILMKSCGQKLIFRSRIRRGRESTLIKDSLLIQKLWSQDGPLILNCLIKFRNNKMYLSILMQFSVGWTQIMNWCSCKKCSKREPLRESEMIEDHLQETGTTKANFWPLTWSQKPPIKTLLSTSTTSIKFQLSTLLKSYKFLPNKSKINSGQNWKSLAMKIS